MAIVKLIYRAFSFILIGWIIIYSLAFIAENTAPDGTSLLLRIDKQNVNLVNNNKDEVRAIVYWETRMGMTLISGEWVMMDISYPEPGETFSK